MMTLSIKLYRVTFIYMFIRYIAFSMGLIATSAIGLRMIAIFPIRPIGYCNLNTLRNTTKIAIKKGAGMIGPGCGGL
jgi:hypothetical protein